MEFSTEEETKHQKNLVALVRLSSFNKKGAIRSHHLIHNSEEWIMKKSQTWAQADQTPR